VRFTAADVSHVAGLARLSLDDASAARFADELTRILAYVDQLGADASGTADDPRPLPLRADVPCATTTEPLLAESAGRVGGLVRVPTVVGEGGS
jgi:aspartyl/glutamyl-tRNA(Asn/Gln) amidotransferase C subunit